MIVRLYETTVDGTVKEASYRGYLPVQVPDDWLESVGVFGFRIAFRNRTAARFPASEGKKQFITHFGFDKLQPIQLDVPKLVKKGEALTFGPESITLSTVLHGAVLHGA